MFDENIMICANLKKKKIYNNYVYYILCQYVIYNIICVKTTNVAVDYTDYTLYYYDVLLFTQFT